MKYPSAHSAGAIRRIHVTRLVCVLVAFSGAGSLASAFSGAHILRWFAPASSSTSALKLPWHDGGGALAAHSSDRGAPWLQLQDGLEVPSSFAASATGVEARSLAAGDMDGDGVQDVVAGYSGREGGIITIARGNVDALYPNAPAAQQRRASGAYTDAPFLEDVRSFPVATVPDLLATGDFDGDGHLDVIVARRGETELQWMHGDGKGGFSSTSKIDVGGKITTVAVGEVDASDGLDDVVIGVERKNRAELLLYPGRKRSLAAEPETIALPGPATSIAFGQFDERFEMDLAVAAGGKLVFVHGRSDVKADGIPEVSQRVETIGLPFQLVALAAGNFVGDRRLDLALLGDDGGIRLRDHARADSVAWGEPGGASKGVAGTVPVLVRAKMSSLPHDDLVIADPNGGTLSVLLGDADRNASSPDVPRIGAETQAIDLGLEGAPVAVLAMRLNGDAWSDLVAVRKTAPGIIAIPTGVTLFTIDSTADTDDANPGDGQCNDGLGNCTLRAALSESNAHTGAEQIEFSIGTGLQTISPATPLPGVNSDISLDATTQPGYSGSPVISLNGSLTDANGLSQFFGVVLIRGLDIRNFTGDGISVSGSSVSTTIEGCYIGTNAAGTAAAANAGSGVNAMTPVTVGGSVAAARNVLSGNLAQGVRLSGSGADGSSVMGNYIGTSATGNAAIGNQLNGVEIDGASNAAVGAAGGGENVVSGNTAGASLSNGIYIHNSAFTNMVLANTIGLGVDGSTSLGNGANGILDGGIGTQIGLSQVGQGNVISGNSGDGVLVQGSSGGPAIQGNLIGTDSTGSSARPNAQWGVKLDTVIGALIGGMIPPEGNVISGNGAGGVALLGSFGIQVASNLIGSAPDGVSSVPNSGDGVMCDGSSVLSLIASNRIFSNLGNGVTILDPSSETAVVSNSITGQTGIGIDINNDGVTPNDVGELDFVQNFPVITAADDDGMGTLTVSGTLDTYQNSHFQIELFLNDSCDSSGFGEGDLFIGTTDVFTDGTGHATFSLGIPGSASVGQVVTATATELTVGGRPSTPQGMFPDTTSEFSACFPVTIPSADLSVTVVGSPTPVQPGADATFTITVNALSNPAAMVSLGSATPANTTFVSLGSPAGWSCVTPPVGSTGPISCVIPSLAVTDGPQVFTLVVNVNPGTPGGTAITDLANVTSSTFDGNPSNNTDSATVLVAVAADVGVTIADAPDPVSAGGLLTYTVTVTNAGPDAATELSVDMDTPPNTTFVSTSAPGGWSCMLPPVGSTGTISCFNNGFAPGSAMFTIRVMVNPATPEATIIDATATVEASTPDPNSGNNSATTSTTVSAAPPGVADLGVTETASPNPVAAGGDLTFTTNVSNAGPAAALDVRVDTAIPENTTLVSVSVPAGWLVVAPESNDPGPLAFTTASLAAGSSASLVVVVRVQGIFSTAATISNSATVSATGTSDPNPSNDTATASATVAQPSSTNLSLGVTATPSSVAPGGTITYTVTATNNGPSEAQDVTISNPIPGNTTFVSASSSADGVCTSPSSGGTGTVVCTWAGATTVGQSRTMTIVVQVSGGAEDQSTISEVASVTSSTPEVDVTDNLAAVSTTVAIVAGATSADLSVTTSAVPSQVDSGDFVTYSIAVRNNGPDTATNVSLSGSTPTGTRLVSIEPSQGTVSGTAPGGQGAFTVAIGDVDAGQTVTITIVVNVIAPGGVVFANTVTVSSDTNDQNAGNNMSASGSTVVVAGNDSLLTWDPPLVCSDDCLNPPLHLQTSTATSGLTRTAARPATTRNTVIGYNIYRSNNPNVQATPSNFFTSVPPTTTSYVAPTAPGGSFFTITAMYPNGESSETNAASGGIPEPDVTGLKIRGNKISVLGSGFSDTVQVFIDGIPFKKDSKVKLEKGRVVQKGKLLTGQSVQQYVSQQGGVILVSVLNEDTGIGTYLYRQ